MPSSSDKRTSPSPERGNEQLNKRIKYDQEVSTLHGRNSAERTEFYDRYLHPIDSQDHQQHQQAGPSQQSGEFRLFGVTIRRYSVSERASLETNTPMNSSPFSTIPIGIESKADISKNNADTSNTDQISSDKHKILNSVKDDPETSEAKASRDKTQQSDVQSSSREGPKALEEANSKLPSCEHFIRTIDQGIASIQDFSLVDLERDVQLVSDWMKYHRLYCLNNRPKLLEGFNKFNDEIKSQFKTYRWKSMFNQDSTEIIQKIKKTIGEYFKLANKQEIEVKNLYCIEDLQTLRRNLPCAYERIPEEEKLGDSNLKKRYEATMKLVDALLEQIKSIGNTTLEEYEKTNIAIRKQIVALTKAWKPLFERYDEVEYRLRIDQQLEAERVRERKQRIEDLLAQLPESCPKLCNLPEKEWWLLYIDAPFHLGARIRYKDDPGGLFDEEASPGYQESMLNLFKTVLAPESGICQPPMNYGEYTKLHELAIQHVPSNQQEYMRRLNGVAPAGYGYAVIRLDPPKNKEDLQERLVAFQEMRSEKINGLLPLLRDWPMLSIPGDDQQLPGIATVMVISEQRQQQYDDMFMRRETSSQTLLNEAMLNMSPYYSQTEVSKHVDAVLQSYADGKKVPNQSKYDRLKEIAMATRALHVMHPYMDGNGRTNIFGFMNQCLQAEGFSPAILPEGPSIFNGIKTLDTLVEHMLIGMHSFIKVVQKD